MRSEKQMRTIYERACAIASQVAFKVYAVDVTAHRFCDNDLAVSLYARLVDGDGSSPFCVTIYQFTRSRNVASIMRSFRRYLGVKG